MAIKTGTLGTIPSVVLDHIQYSEFHMAVGEDSPHTISLSAKCKAYGVSEGVKYYDKKYLPTMSIPNLDAFLSTKVPSDKATEALQGLQKIQEGLGILASIHYNVDFVGVE